MVMKLFLALNKWWKNFECTVNDLIVRSNTHTYRCKTNDVCMTQFPQDIYSETKVDKQDGHIFMKKLEQWINTFNPTLIYLFKCNTDVGSMLSKTSIKAVISYVTDYVTKPSLKTHQIFSSAYDIFEKNSELIGGNTEEKEAACKLLLKIVNALTSKMEIGSPMACLYLLNNPDHYTSHTFVLFWCRTYVSEVCWSWSDSSENLNTKNINFIDRDNSSESDSMDSDNETKSDFTDNEVEKNLGGGLSEYIESDNNMYYEVDKNEKTNLDDNKNNILVDNASVPDNKVNNNEDDPDKVFLLWKKNNYIGQSNVDNYVHQPICYNVLNLYQWIQTSSKRWKPKKNKNKNKNKSCRVDATEKSDGESGGGLFNNEPDNKWEDADLEDTNKYQSFAPDYLL